MTWMFYKKYHMNENIWAKQFYSVCVIAHSKVEHDLCFMTLVT